MKSPLLSVIVPLAPDEGEWIGLREQLGALGVDCEIIVVHAAIESAVMSPRRTHAAISPRVAAVGHATMREIDAPRGRSRQLNAGAHTARGRWLWFLHADSSLHPRTLPALRAFLDREENALGYFDLRYRDDGPKLAGINAIGANFRARCFGLPFGDQGFVLPAEEFARLGGYDEGTDYGEDHLLVWRARAAGLSLVRIGAPLLSSARKYAREGWLRTTARHLVLTARQAWPQWRRLCRETSRDASASNSEGGEGEAVAMPMSAAALAIFVKTPGHSPIKTRLAGRIGVDNAIVFHCLAAAAVMQVACAVGDADRDLQAYWGVAEHEGLRDPLWWELPTLWQGHGDLGVRLHRIYSHLQRSHGCVLLLGADTPQLTPELLRAALNALNDPATPLVLGDARDGGFWLFGGRVPIPETIWRNVRYSQADTAAQLRAAIMPLGHIANLPTLTDVDNVSDLAALVDALDALPDPLPAQRTLRAWLQARTAGSLLTAMRA